MKWHWNKFKFQKPTKKKKKNPTHNESVLELANGDNGTPL